MISVNNLCKYFKIQKRREGFSGYVRDIFDRQYEIKHAVRNISFEIPDGEIIGYLGPNGAGKSTTIKMLTGILVPTSGKIIVNGVEPHKDRKRYAKQIGVVFGQRTQLWWDIPVADSLSLIKYMYHIPEDIYNANIKCFKEILGLDEFMTTAVRQLSLGQRMRADLACAMLHDPKILFLDEPTIGLDVVVKENIRQFIKEMNRTRKTTVILTTHDMLDVEKLCSRIMIIDTGAIMYDGDLKTLMAQYGTEQSIRIEFAKAVLDNDILRSLPMRDVTVNDKVLTASYDGTEISSIRILDAVRGDNPIVDFKVTEANTDDIIRKMYQALPSIKHKEG